jgi:hypothetical protein
VQTTYALFKTEGVVGRLLLPAPHMHCGNYIHNQAPVDNTGNYNAIPTSRVRRVTVARSTKKYRKELVTWPKAQLHLNRSLKDVPAKLDHNRRTGTPTRRPFAQHNQYRFHRRTRSQSNADSPRTLAKLWDPICRNNFRRSLNRCTLRVLNPPELY